MRMALASAMLVVALGCGGVEEDAAPLNVLGGDAGHGGDGSGGDGSGGDAAGGDTAGGDGTGGDAGVQCLSIPATPYCRLGCDSDDDCTAGANAANRQRCEDGACTWIGCSSTTDCTTVHGAGYACVLLPCATHKSCMKTCSRPADCAAASGAYDADNYACDGGVCSYIGCHSDSECQVTSPSTLCSDPHDTDFDACYPACNSASDCAYQTPLYDASHWQCRENACVWRGCASTSECRTAYGDAYVCR